MTRLRSAVMPESTTAEPMAKPSKNWWKDSATNSVPKALPPVTPSVMPISTEWKMMPVSMR